MGEKQDQIIFIEGKEKGLKSLFSQANFGYLALGYSESDNGFFNPSEGDTEGTYGGFHEIDVVADPTYERVPLIPNGEVTKDVDTGKVSVQFTADINIDNIIDQKTINQFAICDSGPEPSAATTFYAASTFPNFNKSSDVAITFLIEMKI